MNVRNKGLYSRLVVNDLEHQLPRSCIYWCLHFLTCQASIIVICILPLAQLRASWNERSYVGLLGNHEIVFSDERECYPNTIATFADFCIIFTFGFYN